jgi:hypothetical protein
MAGNDPIKFFFMGGKYKIYPLFFYETVQDPEYPHVSMIYVPPRNHKEALAIKNRLYLDGEVDGSMNEDGTLTLYSKEDRFHLKHSVRHFGLERVFGIYSGGLGIMAYKQNKNPSLMVIDHPYLSASIFAAVLADCQNGSLSKGEDLFLIGESAWEAMNLITCPENF